MVDPFNNFTATMRIDYFQLICATRGSNNLPIVTHIVPTFHQAHNIASDAGA